MYVFVYGTLKRGFINNWLLTESYYICPTRTNEEYLMVNLNYFPGVLELENDEYIDLGEPKSKISGELYKVDNRTISTLDKFEEPFFYRKRTYLENGVEAWMYFLKNEYYNDDSNRKIENGFWR
ncbi:gamma-glutamylcyclotransferase family protein [Methanosalsum natronophilum]|uniref:Gamma-glutamylcyclotransferase n=1 Tax=Methanosalsum natronophilum TaxID=768733 RepID=A0A424YN99_9EURY|nr:gamma-glutamylcyclotransferase family protein [Methanosalsum natronophilum]MCS3924595.1 gamma-glutamylcyclotransferase (GGCT)/AIG2-like uncharacterized protein YtfP [Methanosalsum natronophilum]RQD80410.1 MAG: gamma-glutamylcyclotransferase [Methanosalsum natronophilum]